MPSEISVDDMIREYWFTDELFGSKLRHNLLWGDFGDGYNVYYVD